MTDPTAHRRSHGSSGDADDPPLTPEQERTVRRVRRVLLLGAAIMFGGFAVVILTVSMRLMNTPETAATPSAGDLGGPVSAAIVLRAGERVTGATTAGGLVTVTTAASGGGRVLVLDLGTLALVREIELSSQ